MEKSNLCSTELDGTTDQATARIRIPYETAEDRGVYLDLELDGHNLAATFIPEEQAEIPDIRSAVAAGCGESCCGKEIVGVACGRRKSCHNY